jgi:hypothetical protein
MDLVQGRSARQRNDFVLRLGCWMVTLSMVFSLVIQPPKAKAIVAEASLATSVIWAFMQSAGITFNGTGMNSSSWAEGIEPYLREFTEATDSAAKSFWHWLGYENGAADFIKALSWSKITHPSTMPFPSVTIPPAVAKKLARFTVWFAEKVGLASGGESKPVVSISGGTRLKLSNGQSIVLGSCVNPDSSGLIFYEPGTVLFNVVQDMYQNFANYSWLYTFANGCSLKLFLTETGKPVINAELRNSNGSVIGLNNDSSTYNRYLFYWGQMSYDAVGLAVAADGNTIVPIMRSCSKDWNPGKWLDSWSRGDYWCKGLALNDLESFKTSDAAGSAAIPGALSPTYDDTGEKATIITIPGLDTEIAGINDLLQAILDKLAANELTTSATIAQQPTPEQPDEEKPDLDGLGLPALGAALMTRFPFSIPWDVVRGIKLLAAPAEAPYWEVDFLAPIAGRVGGWKGSTKVVIDMGQYEIIGQLCRWTSTIGFCLVLAAGTKKLIWTA